VSDRVLRTILIVAGAYWLADWLADLLATSEAAIGTVYSGSGRLGELWISIRAAAPRTLAAAGATALLWLTLEAGATRRWMWALAVLFAVFGFVSRQFHAVSGVEPDPVSRGMNVAVYCLLPTVGCLAALWLLPRVVPATGDMPSVSDSGAVAARGRSRALVIASGVLGLLGGAFLGTWITATVDIQQASGWTLSVIDSARRSEYALAQYREAEYDEAKAALEQFAVYLEGLRPADSDWQPGEAPFSGERGLAFDRLLTYGRLALRAERANRTDEASDYWQRAEGHAQVLKWEKPTRDRIRITVTRLDRDQPKTSNTLSR
jgi:hypothetical protein